LFSRWSPWRTVAVIVATSAAIVALALTLFGDGRVGAASPRSAEVVSGTLFVRGSGAADAITVRLRSGDPGTLEVDFGDDGTADLDFDRATFSAIQVLGAGDSDTVRVDDAFGAFTDTEVTTLDGGSGNDILFGGAGSEAVVGQGGNDVVDAGGGSDILVLGTGSDTTIWNPGDGNDTIDGQAGTDTFALGGDDADEIIDLSPNGPLVRVDRNGGADQMDLLGLEVVDVTVAGGTDVVTVNDMTSTAARRVTVDLEATGGGGDAQPDQVIVNGTAGADSIVTVAGPASTTIEGLTADAAVTGAEPALDVLHINGRDGMDSFERSTPTGPLLNTVFDGGAETDSAIVEGTAGADVFAIFANGLFARLDDGSVAFFEVTATESVNVLGRDGNDTFSATGNLAALIPTLAFDGGSGNDTVSGGNGRDILVGGIGNDFIDSQQGEDIVYLGSGNDTAQWDPGDGNDIIEGGSGTDALAFNGNGAPESIGIAPNGTRVRFTRNVASIALDLAGLETIGFTAAGGADLVTVDDLTGTGVKTVAVDLRSFGLGDTQPDQVTFLGTAGPDVLELTSAAPAASAKGLAVTPVVTGAEPGLDAMVLNGAGGNDTIKVVPGSAPIDLVPDGGADIDTVYTDGTAGNDTFDISANGARARISTASGSYFDVGSVETVRVNGKGGADMFFAVGNLAAILPSLVLDGGGGNDVINGSNGADMILAGGGNDVVDGQQGDDLLLLGSGADRAQWDPGDGNDTIEGQDGSDTLVFNGSGISEMLDASANGSRVRLFRNVANITLDLDGMETINLNAVGGADAVTVGDLTGTATRFVNVSLAAVVGGGDLQPDQVVVTGTNGVDAIKVTGASTSASVKGLTAIVNITGAELALDRLDVQTLAGVDSVDSTGLVPNVIQLSVDGIPVP
jgi:Ca2+-binding RTX toxin-like protein